MLRSDEAKRRNIEKAIRVLSGATERFLGRDWNGRSIEAEPGPTLIDKGLPR